MPASDIIDRLAARGLTVATCESITAGLICGALTAIPGSSRVVRGGLITYATDTKSTLAGVDPNLIATQGVVSEAVALAMANGARQLCGADWGVAVTGVAGPGPADGVAAGTTWLAIVGPATSRTVLLCETGDRATIRHRVVQQALEHLTKVLA